MLRARENFVTWLLAGKAARRQGIRLNRDGKRRYCINQK